LTWKSAVCPNFLLKSPSPKTSVVTVPALSPRIAGDGMTPSLSGCQERTGLHLQKSPIATPFLDETFSLRACDFPRQSIWRIFDLRAPRLIHIGNRFVKIFAITIA
jgi:hypothetical protein